MRDLGLGGNGLPTLAANATESVDSPAETGNPIQRGRHMLESSLEPSILEPITLEPVEGVPIVYKTAILMEN